MKQVYEPWFRDHKSDPGVLAFRQYWRVDLQNQLVIISTVNYWLSISLSINLALMVLPAMLTAPKEDL